MKFLKKIFILPTPVELGRADRNALPVRWMDSDDPGYCWEDYHDEMKDLYPFRYFMNHTVPHWWAVRITIPMEHFFYRLKSTYKKYHLLDLRQPYSNTTDDYEWGYADECTQIVYANFNILVNYYYGLIDSEISWDATSEGIKKFEEYIDEVRQNESEDSIESLNHQLNHLKEVNALYRYWTVSRKIKLKKWDILLREWSKNKSIDRKQDNSIRWNSLNEFEADFYAEEENMLIRLIKIRRGLWI